MYSKLSNTPQNEQVKGLISGIIKYIQSPCTTSLINKLNKQFAVKMNHFKSLLDKIEEIENVYERNILRELYSYEINKSMTEKQNFENRVKLVNSLTNLKLSETILKNIATNVLVNFLPENTSYRYVDYFNGGSCPMSSENNDGFLCEFGPNPIVGAIVNLLLTVDLNLEMYMVNQNLSFGELNSKILIGLRDIQTSLPIFDPNEFVFNPDPTSCKYAQTKRQNFIEDAKMRNNSEGFYVNDFTGSVDVSRNPGNIAN